MLAEASKTPLHVESEDVAQATVLDPNGASGYDVSSSDLGDPLAEVAPVESIATMMDAPGDFEDAPFGSPLDLDSDEPVAIAMDAPGDFDDAPIAAIAASSVHATARGCALAAASIAVGPLR